MTDETPSTSTTQAMPVAAGVAASPLEYGGAPPPSAAQDDASLGSAASDRPELVVAGAFAAGFVIALIFKRLGQ